jgi:hypothetical protein
MDTESQKWLAEARDNVAKLRMAGQFELADNMEAAVAKAEAKGGFTPKEREWLTFCKQVIAPVLGDFIKEFRKSDDELRNDLSHAQTEVIAPVLAELREEFRHALAAVNSRISTLEVLLPKDRS